MEQAEKDVAAFPEGEARARRPFGLAVLGLVYIVLGSHALMFGTYLAWLTPAGAPTLPLGDFLVGHVDVVRAYALALVGIAFVFFAQGLGLWRGKPWTRWSTPCIAWLHFLGPPFLLGGVLFALLVNLYVAGARAPAEFYRGEAPSVAGS